MQNLNRADINFTTDTWPIDQNKPSILFIHGAGLSKLIWEKQVSSLSKTANTISIDLPGHGLSKKKALQSIEDYAKCVISFINEIDLKNCFICGLSMGGAIVQWLMINNEDMFKGAILICTGAKLSVTPEIFTAIENDYTSFIQMTQQFAVSSKTDPAKIIPVIKDMELCPKETALSDFKVCNNFNVIDSVSKIKKPVLIITGKDDKLTPEKYGIFLEKKITSAQRVNINEAGHLIPVEKPEELNSSIIRFISQNI